MTIRRTTQFKGDIKRVLQSGKDIEKLLSIIEDLTEGRKLSPEHHDHPLIGKYKNKRDCHIEPDWILIYAIEDNELVLYRTGSHSQLFRQWYAFEENGRTALYQTTYQLLLEAISHVNPD